jgi:hypothetical protein
MPWEMLKTPHTAQTYCCAIFTSFDPQREPSRAVHVHWIILCRRLVQWFRHQPKEFLYDKCKSKKAKFSFVHT